MGSRPIHLINIVPLSEGINRYDPMHAPLGILYVGSALKRRGFPVVLHHITPDKSDETVREIVSDPPLWVGFSVLSGLTTHYAARMSQGIKARSDVPILWGGHHPSLLGFQCLGEPYIDFVCVGEGEETAVEFSEALLRGPSAEGVRGIGYKKDGHPVMNEARGWIRALDQLELDWSLLDLKRYYPKVGTWYGLSPSLEARIGEKRFVTLFSSRGCPFHCGFCSTREYSGPLWRAHSVEYLLDQVSRLEQEIGPIGMVAFCDDNLMVDPRRGLNIIERLYARGILVDYINIRIDQLTDTLIEAFARYEVHSVFFGFESGNPRLLRLMNKNIVPEQIMDRVSTLQRFPEITVTTSGILGIPTATEEEVREDITFALKVHRMIRNGIVSLFCFMPLPCTKLTELAVEQGFKPPGRTEDWKVIDPQYEGYQMSWLPWMTPEKLNGLHMTQTLMRNFMPKVPTLSPATRGYLSTVSSLNRWRIGHQRFWALNAQQALERGVRRLAVNLLGLRARGHRGEQPR